MKSSFPLLLLLLAAIAMIANAASPEPQQDEAAYQRGYAAASQAYQNYGSAVPDGPAPTPKPGDTCPDCNGSGRVGDGTVFQKCLACEGTGKVQAVHLTLSADTAPGWQLIPGVVASESESLQPPVFSLPPDADGMHEMHDEPQGRRFRLFRRRRGRSSGMGHSSGMHDESSALMPQTYAGDEVCMT